MTQFKSFDEQKLRMFRTYIRVNWSLSSESMQLEFTCGLKELGEQCTPQRIEDAKKYYLFVARQDCLHGSVRHVMNPFLRHPLKSFESKKPIVSISI